ncbi:hypothetical protein RA28_08630 [Ruegeria sp. ANG-S4]|nr:hypothetical protein RA28_08630 [Ruegeria sp. ANG-S4]
MAQYSQTESEFVAIPVDVFGTRTGVYFLLRTPGRRKFKVRLAEQAANLATRPSWLKRQSKRGAKAAPQLDEFVFK